MSKALAKKNVFDGLGDMLAGGFDPLLASNENEVLIDLDDIEIVAQVREEFEDDEHSLADLGRSLQKRQLQAIIVRPVDGLRPYRLVAGERRVRAARLAGLEQLRGRVIAMTDDEAEDAQLAENIHRKNLTQIEEAKKIQRDLDRLGSVDAVLDKHQKSRAWLSKTLGLLRLPAQAKRLMTENVSADVEVINTVKTIERSNPIAAKALVDELKQSRGKANARERAAAVKEQVKGKKPPVQEVKGTAVVDAARVASGILDEAYSQMIVDGRDPGYVLSRIPSRTRPMIENWLSELHAAGKRTSPEKLSRAVAQKFVLRGSAAFALVAVLDGFRKTKFSLSDVFDAVGAAHEKE